MRRDPSRGPAGGRDPSRTHAADFTVANYRRLLRKARGAYPFAGYPEAGRLDRFVLWRHDVDYSVHRAAALAGIEKEEGVLATYFFQLTSFAYSLFEPAVRDLAVRILGMGHRAGLHFDPSACAAGDAGGLARRLRFEKGVLTELLGTAPEALSFHNPSPDIGERFPAARYAGMVNASSRRLREGAGYCSDSNGYWRHERLEDVLDAARVPKLQVLTHPEWWQERPMAPRARIGRCIDGRAARAHAAYDALLAACGRKNVR